MTRVLGVLLQLLPIATIAFFFFVMSKPPDHPRGIPGVVASGPALRFMFPYSILLGAAGIAALFSLRAAHLAALVTIATFYYAVRLRLEWPPQLFDGTFFACLAGLSLAGWVLRVYASRRAASERPKSEQT